MLYIHKILEPINILQNEIAIALTSSNNFAIIGEVLTDINAIDNFI